MDRLDVGIKTDSFLVTGISLAKFLAVNSEGIKSTFNPRSSIASFVFFPTTAILDSIVLSGMDSKKYFTALVLVKIIQS